MLQVLPIDVNIVYRRADLLSKLRFASENINLVIHQMESRNEVDRIITVYDLLDADTEFKHPLITLTRRVDENLWTGIMSISPMGNTKPVRVVRKQYHVHIDPANGNTSVKPVAA